MKKTISIIVPVYNVEKYIIRCAQSIFEQTYDNLDIIFVDDCSPDKSIEVMYQLLEQYPQRKEQVRVIKHEKNRGLACARNTGVEAAQGDWLTHVDSDDFLDKSTISRCVERIEKTNADAVIFGMNHILPNKVYPKLVHVPETSHELVKLMLMRKIRFNLCGGIYKTSLYKNNGIHAIEGINDGEDYSVSPRLLYYAQKIVDINIPLYNYVHFENDNSYTNRFSINDAKSHVKILSLLRDFFENKDEQELLKAIDYGETMIKRTLLLKWAIGKNEDQYLQFINDNYKTFPLEYSLSDRLLLSLYNKPLLLKLYCRIGFRIKQVLK